MTTIETTTNGMTPATPATKTKRKPASKPKAKVKAAPKRAAKRKAKRKAKTGADRVPGQHIMSVHIPVGMMAKMDRKIAGLVRAKKMSRPSRSGYIVKVIARSL